MSVVRTTTAPVRHADRLFIDGAWVQPSSDATIDVIDSGTEELYYRVAAAGPDDVSRAVAAARRAFDEGPWPRSTHAERAEVLRAFAAGIQERGDVLGQLWPRETGTIYKNAQYAGRIGSGAMAQYAALADTFPWEEECPPTAGGEFGLLVREPVGVVGAIIPWNAPVALICHKIAPALLAGCTVVLKSAPEAPGEGYVFAEVAEEIGLPPGVLNVVTADREVSELLVRDAGRRQDHLHRIDRRRAAHRVVVRRAHRAVHARARREVGGRDPRRYRPRHGGQDDRPRRVRAQRAGVLVADKDRRDEEPPRRSGRGAGVEVLADAGGRSVRRADAAGPTGLRTAARSRRGLHRQGRVRGCDARGRWRTPRGTGPGVLRGADGLRQRRQQLDDRSRRDLRSRAQRDRCGRRA